MFKKILIAIDGSKNARIATKYAINFSKEFNSDVTIIHVISEMTIQNYMQFTKAKKKQVVEKLKKKADAYFKDALKEVKEKELKVRTLTIIGIPAIEITDFAKEEKIDLIVMGTHGLTGSTRILLGSVAEEVIRLSSCPTLTVKA